MGGKRSLDICGSLYLIQGMSDSVTTTGQGPNSRKIQEVTESDIPCSSFLQSHPRQKCSHEKWRRGIGHVILVEISTLALELYLQLFSHNILHNNEQTKAEIVKKN